MIKWFMKPGVFYCHRVSTQLQLTNISISIYCLVIVWKESLVIKLKALVSIFTQNLRKDHIKANYYFSEFAKLWNASICCFIRIEPLGRQWMNCHVILIFHYFSKSLEKYQLRLEHNKHVVYFTWRPFCIYHFILTVLFKFGNVLTKLCRENRGHSQHKYFRYSCSLIYNVKMIR
jgi:hypothetical protein